MIRSINQGTGGGSTIVQSFLTSQANLLWCVDGGSYATGQAAVNAAVDNTIILFGAKASGNWGDIVLPAGKRIHLVGLQAKSGLLVVVNSITFSPTTGLNINLNECAIENLYIQNTSIPNNAALIFGGTAPARLRVYNCYINASSGSGDLITASNSGSGSSLYLDNCVINGGASTKTVLTSSCYVRVNKCKDFFGGAKGIQINSGTCEINDSIIQCNSTNEVINIANGGLLYGGLMSVKNDTTNGSGIVIQTGGVASYAASGFDVAAGTGYCVRGGAGGILVYDRFTFSNSSLQARNVKFQNTIALYTFTLTPSVVA